MTNLDQHFVQSAGKENLRMSVSYLNLTRHSIFLCFTNPMVQKIRDIEYFGMSNDEDAFLKDSQDDNQIKMQGVQVVTFTCNFE